MSSGRFSLCLALAACLASGAASAEGDGEGTSWTDPPARTAPQEVAKPAEPKPPEPARTERAPEPERNAPTQARQDPPAPPRSSPPQSSPPPVAPTQAEQRQEQIRRAVARSTAEREAEARGVRMPRRSVVERPAISQRSVERPRRMSERLPPSYLRGRQASRPRSIRRPVYGYADPMPAYERYGAGPSAYDGPDAQARRIAQARSAGYLVMRSRSYAYPDGIVVRRLSPLGGDDFYD
ncbi:hypothetical protein [Methylorubrum salsuginis]|uniref:Uncharacterized protein n=1 Tax=Methylorubrum salsuginis TaxID=414703 RepID=A0A1I4JEH7_9HYPH|nr:hypothetical protein [Methylorubrum salsuginis]SFL64944.1 hypothetical protein SAMN04488125_1204 [Methylorubrum salsuginis]